MTLDEIVETMQRWWDLEDGFIEGDPSGRGIDHPLNWRLIVTKILDLDGSVTDDAV